MVAVFTVTDRALWISLSLSAVHQRGVVGVEVVVGTVTGCSPRSRDGVSSGGEGLFFWASSFSVSCMYSSFTGSLHCCFGGSRVFSKVSMYDGSTLWCRCSSIRRVCLWTFSLPGPVVTSVKHSCSSIWQCGGHSKDPFHRPPCSPAGIC